MPKKIKNKDRHTSISFSLSPIQIEKVIEISNKHAIPQSNLIGMYIDYFNSRPTVLEELVKKRF